MRRLTKVYTDGSKEQLQAQKNYQNKLVENQKRNQKIVEDNEKKHKKELDKIKGDYFGDNKTEKKEKYDKETSALDEVYAQEIRAAGNDAKEKLRIEEAYQKAKVALAKKYGQEYNDTSKNFLENITEDITEWLNSDLGQAVQGSFDTLTSGMSSIFSGMTSLIQAELEIQTAAIEKRYDKEISQAEGNNYKVKKLEEQKQKELAKKKNEANKRCLPCRSFKRWRRRHRTPYRRMARQRPFRLWVISWHQWLLQWRWQLEQFRLLQSKATASE